MAEFRIRKIMQAKCPPCDGWYDLDTAMQAFPKHYRKVDGRNKLCENSGKPYYFVGTPADKKKSNG